VTKVHRRNTNNWQRTVAIHRFSVASSGLPQQRPRVRFISAGQRAALLVQVAVGRGERLVVFVEFVRKTSEKIEDV